MNNKKIIFSFLVLVSGIQFAASISKYTPEQQEMLDAVMYRRLDYKSSRAAVQKLIEQGVNPNDICGRAPTISGKPLWLAVLHNDEPYVDWLLERGADPNKTHMDLDGRSVFDLAQSPSISAKLLQKGATISKNALFNCYNAEKAKFLVKFGADPKYHSGGLTALAYHIIQSKNQVRNDPCHAIKSAECIALIQTLAYLGVPFDRCGKPDYADYGSREYEGLSINELVAHLIKNSPEKEVREHYMAMQKTLEAVAKELEQLKAERATQVQHIAGSYMPTDCGSVVASYDRDHVMPRRLAMELEEKEGTSKL